MIWSLLPTISAPMSFQMALDELLFQNIKENPATSPIFRFYYSSEPWITVGYSFRDERDALRSELIKKNPKVPVAKRLTGGGCVLHGEDLIFSLIIRAEQDPESFGQAQESYRRIHECVAAAFQTLGFPPRFYREAEELPKGDDCFAYPVTSDLSWKNQKVAGGAQKRSEGVLLHHESIMIPKGMNAVMLMGAIKKAFKENLCVAFQECNLDPELFYQASTSKKDHRLKVEACCL